MIDKPVVLIVDDSPTNIQVLATCLKDQYQIKVATGGEQCLQLVGENLNPDLILLDVEMPGMSGYEVCRQLKNKVNTRDVPIIFVTGRDKEGDEEKGLQMGAVDYITKPIRPIIVSARVKTHITLKQQHDKLQKMALYDQLTDLYNRHYLLEVVSHKISHAVRHKNTLSLLMMDIDHFKAINDEHGHPVGDAVLQAVAKILKAETRKEDVAARFGGEEFVMVLDHCDAAMAADKAEDLRGLIEGLKPVGIKVTVSIGVAQLHADDSDFESLLERADKAVYKAKDQGRNCVVVSK